MFGPATDMWALGVTFYYLLTGYHPYMEAKSLGQLKELITTKEINFSLIRNKLAR